MQKIELSLMQVALINQALDYYKLKVEDIIDAAEEEPNFCTHDFVHRLRWLKTEAAHVQVLATKNLCPQQLTMSQYHPKS